MITSLHLTPTHLFSLTSTPTISVYNVKQFVPTTNQSLPKIQSQLGICLRKPNVVFNVPFMNRDVKFADYEKQKTCQKDLLFLYDKQNVVGLDLKGMTSQNMPELEVMLEININTISNTEQKATQIVSVLVFNDDQTSQSNLLITTENGKIHLVKITPTKALDLIASKNVQQLHSPDSHIITEEQQRSVKLVKTQQIHKDNEYVCVTSFVNNQLYLATNYGKLLTLDSKTLKLKATFENDFTKNKPKGTLSSLGLPLRIIVIRNSVLVLYSRAILEFNAYTHTLANTISLPVSTLDLTIMQSSKTLSSSLLLIGECNSLYSMDFPIHLPNKNTADCLSIKTSSVKISSRLGKCIATLNNIVFVGGSDGTIDVLVNGQMALVVLVQDQ